VLVWSSFNGWARLRRAEDRVGLSASGPERNHARPEHCSLKADGTARRSSADVLLTRSRPLTRLLPSQAGPSIRRLPSTAYSRATYRRTPIGAAAFNFRVRNFPTLEAEKLLSILTVVGNPTILCNQ
jgi:hypothetical protein